MAFPFEATRNKHLFLFVLVFNQLLYEEWASYSVFYKYQPIGLVR